MTVIYTQKPLLGTPVNLKHPMMRGCKVFFALNEGAGKIARNAVSDLHASITMSNSTTAWQKPGYMACSSVQGLLSFPRPVPTIVNQPQSFVTRITATTLSLAASLIIFGPSNSDTFNLKGTRVLNLVVDGQQLTTNQSVVPVADKVDIAYTYNGSATQAGMHIYVNGIEITDVTFGAAINISADISTWNINKISTLSVWSMEFAAWFDRMLTAEEITQWRFDPYAAFRTYQDFRLLTGYTQISNSFLYNGSKFLFTPIIYFEAFLKSSVGIGRCRLWDVTALAPVIGSEVTTTSSLENRIRSGAINLITGHEYYVQAGASTSGTTTVRGANLRFNNV